MESLKLIVLSIVLISFSGCTNNDNSQELNTTTTVDKNESLETELNETLPITTPVIEVNKSIVLDNFINDTNCDQVLEKEFSTGSFLSICYDYEYKSARYVAYTLDGELVNKLPSIEERPRFYTEAEIPREYQIFYSDYTNSGYDRGHLAPDADFDYNEEDLKVIYTLANIIPQDPNVNRYFWSKAEYQERLVAATLGELNVINGVVFDENPTYIGENGIAVSKGFWKILYNDEKEFRQCYYYDNFVLFDADEDTLDKHLVDCNTLIIGDES
jgi:endonuclease G